MAVLMPNCALTVRARERPVTRDARGNPKVTGGDIVTERGPYPGSAHEQADGTWKLRLDPACWPVRAGDEITDGTRVWYAHTDPKLTQLPGISDVDSVTLTATIDPPRPA